MISEYLSEKVISPLKRFPEADGVEEQETELLGTAVMASITRINDHPTHLDRQLCLQERHQIQYGFSMNSLSASSSIPGNVVNKEGGAYDLGELDQAVLLYFDGQDSSTVQDQPQSSGMRPPTLNIFPSHPMHLEPSPTPSTTPIVSLSSASNNAPNRQLETSTGMELANAPNNATASRSLPQPPKSIKRESNRRAPTSSSEQEGPKSPDPKTLRRLAQNREAARKSRLRKKAYVQQLESSRIKLTQLEQELQRARSQGIVLGGGNILGDQGLSIGTNNISPDAAVFDMEYGRWVEEHHRITCELRAAVQEHVTENELRLHVESWIAHLEEMINLKSMLAKTDVFHIISGEWMTLAERCFMWIGGFRPSYLIKVILSQMEPLTEQQMMGVCGLQRSTQEGEDALSQGLEAMNHSVSDTMTSDSLTSAPNMVNYMAQMALAINKLSAIEGFVSQADNLRLQMIHRLHQILTTRQSARCLLAMSEYFRRLRALSFLWMARPRQE